MLNINDITLRKDIAILESNLVVYFNKGKERINELRETALDRTRTLINNWARYLVDEIEPEIHYNDAQQKIESVFTMNDLSIEAKLKKTEEILTISQKDAVSRLKKHQENRDEHIITKMVYTKQFGIYKTIFVWLQILGLILLATSEIIEKLTRKAEQP